MNGKILSIFLLILCVLLGSLFVIGAFWHGEDDLLTKARLPKDRTTQLHDAIEETLNNSALFTRYEPRTPAEADVAADEYAAQLPRASVLPKVLNALTERIAPLGGEIYQTYIQPEAQQATVVIGTGGFITHTLVISWPVPEVTVAPQPTPTPVSRFRAAIVIDDLGADLEIAQRLLAYQTDFTFSILPHQKYSKETAELLHQHHCEILMHQPMQAENAAMHPGRGAIWTRMTAAQIRQTIERNLESVPFAVGVNNHMGSLLTRKEKLMRAVLLPIQERRLFFLDSRTSGKTVAYQVAQRMGLKTAQRDIFLDAQPGLPFARKQLATFMKLAERQQPVIAIGHPKEATFQAFDEMLPEFQRREIRIVRLSELLP